LSAVILAASIVPKRGAIRRNGLGIVDGGPAGNALPVLKGKLVQWKPRNSVFWCRILHYRMSLILLDAASDRDNAPRRSKSHFASQFCCCAITPAEATR
jgi:hypothetical protein